MPSVEEDDSAMPSQIGKIYVCSACGSQVIVTKAGSGTLRCCGADMQQKK